MPPTSASAAERADRKSRLQFVKASPRATGTELWKTMAPVMFPRARVSLLFLSQMTELNFSGSSVARGASTSAIRPAGTPTDLERCSTALTKKWAPTAITAIVPTNCAATAHVGASEEEGHRV